VLQRAIQGSVTLDVSGLQSGVYILQVEGAEQTQVRKFLKH